MTVTQIVAEVISEVGADADDSDLQTKVVGWAPAVLRRFPRWARNRTFKQIKTLALSSGSSSGTLPSGVVEIQDRGIWWQGSDGLRREVVRLRDRRDFNLRFSGNSSGAPNYCYIYGTTVEFNRKADQAYTINIESFVDLDSVTGSSEWALAQDIIETFKDGLKWIYFDDYLENEGGMGDKKGAVFDKSLKKLLDDFTESDLPGYVVEASEP